MQFFKKSKQTVLLLLLLATFALPACSYNEWKAYNAAGTSQERQSISDSAQGTAFTILMKVMNNQPLTPDEQSRKQAFNTCGFQGSTMCYYDPNQTLLTTQATTTTTSCTAPTYDPGCHCVRCH